MKLVKFAVNFIDCSPMHSLLLLNYYLTLAAGDFDALLMLAKQVSSNLELLIADLPSHLFFDCEHRNRSTRVFNGPNLTSYI